MIVKLRMKILIPMGSLMLLVFAVNVGLASADNPVDTAHDSPGQADAPIGSHLIAGARIIRARREPYMASVGTLIIPAQTLNSLQLLRWLTIPSVPCTLMVTGGRTSNLRAFDREESKQEPPFRAAPSYYMDRCRSFWATFVEAL